MKTTTYTIYNYYCIHLSYKQKVNNERNFIAFVCSLLGLESGLRHIAASPDTPPYYNNFCYIFLKAGFYTMLLSRRESFSMVTAEFLCCGTHVVGFKVGGTKSIALSNYCTFIEYRDIDNIVNRLSNIPTYDKALDSTKGKEAYSKESMEVCFTKVYKF